MTNAENNSDTPGKGRHFTLPDLLWIYVLSQGILIVAVAVLAAGQNLSSLPPGLMVGILLATPVLLVVLVFVAALLRRQVGFLVSRFSLRNASRLLWWGLGVGIVARVLGGVVLYIEEEFDVLPVVPNNPFVNELAGLESTGMIALAVLAIVILGPIAEEIFYRAVVLRVFNRYLPGQLALVASAVVFGAVHFNLGLFVPLALAGYFFGYVYLRFESLIPAIVAHAAFNAIAVVTALLTA